MIGKRVTNVLAAALALALAGTAAAQKPATPKPAAQKPAAAAPAAAQPAATPANDVDPDAVAALERMGTYLRTIKTFRVTAATTRDRVLASGQLAQSSAQVDILAQFPSRLLAEVVGSGKHRLYFYDGTSFTLYGKVLGYYATVPAPPTIGKLAPFLDDTYGLSIPLEDLFFWGTEKANTAAIVSATEIGPVDVQGTTCTHYAFRQEGIDWQVWIQLGEYPLPRKLVITTTSDEARPQYSAVYTWDLAPSYNEAAFTFDPPDGAYRVPLASDSAEKAGK